MSASSAWRVLALAVLAVPLLPCIRSSRHIRFDHTPSGRLPLGSHADPGIPQPDSSAAQPGSELQKPCPPGCEQHGTCNREMARCDCPVGREGPDCSVLKYADCMPDPSAPRGWCGTQHPKSCECVRQCKAVLCPKAEGGNCRYYYDASRAKCFERSNTSSTALAAAAVAAANSSLVFWRGGSEVPAEDDTSVTYYSGAERGPDPAAGVITRQAFLSLEHNPGVNPLLAAPLRDCPASCHLRGLCQKRQTEPTGTCICHQGFKGPDCNEVDDTLCLNNCSGRGECKAGFCHCRPGYWGRDCWHSRVHAPNATARSLTALRVYAYDLPMEVAWQPEYEVGQFHHDGIYTAWKAFMEQFYNDTVYRTDNPWEANLFYIPAMTYAFSSNLGDTTTHARAVIRWVAQTYPFFNRSGGVDHFLWLTNDRGACHWPGDSEPEMANVMKVVHFAWANSPTSAMAEHFHIPNKRWGCFHPLRDVAAPPHWIQAPPHFKATYGPNGTFDPNVVPPKLFFFAGGMRHNDQSYSFGVRQAIWQRVHNKSSAAPAAPDPRVTYSEERVPDYHTRMAEHKYCLAPAGHGWGIRLSQYMWNGCVPVIIQDGVYQPFEELLPYHEFSIRLSKKDIPNLLQLLETIPDTQYLALRRALPQYWQAFNWDPSLGGKAFHHVMQALQVRVDRLRAGHIHVLRRRRGGGSTSNESVEAGVPGVAQPIAEVEVDDGHGGGEGSEQPSPSR